MLRADPGLPSVPWSDAGTALFALSRELLLLVHGTAGEARIVAAGAAFALQTGVPAEALRGRPLAGLLIPGASAAELAALAAGETPPGLTLRMAGPGLGTGLGRWNATLRCTALPGDGHRLLVFSPAAPAQLLARSALELAIDAARIGIYRYDLAAERIYYNDHGWAQIQMAPRPEGIALADLQVVHPDDLPTVRDAGQRALASGAVADAQARYLLADGEVRHFFSRRVAQRDAAGRPVALVGVVIDLTEQVDQAERSLTLARRLDELCATLGIGLWGQDREGRDAQWNAQMWTIYDLPPQPCPPSLPELLALRVHADDRDRVRRCVMDWVASDRLVIEMEYRIVRGDGSERCIEALTHRRRTGERAPIYGIARDVTERHDAELARDTAERENRAKSQFLARMSHELRTPLNAMLGFTQLLDAQLDAPRHREQLDHVRLAGEHLLALINDALDLARVQADELTLSLEPVDADALLPEVLALVRPAAERRAITIVITGAAGWVQADRVRLRQVLINLLSNAVKYNRDGGRIIVDGTRAAARARIAVRDTGRGLDALQLGRLFEPFNRLGAEGSGVEGTGIGLAIVKGLVERMGGRVTVSSVPGAGSEFVLDLPAAEPDASAVDGRPGFARSGPGPLEHAGRLLYIEDNPVNVLLMTEMLERHTRFELTTADTGGAGVAQAAALRPDLVLVDMQLPDFDGYEVLRRLRADPATAGLRCIALSANALPSDIERALALGFDDYWTKPIDLKGFLRALDALFSAD